MQSVMNDLLKESGLTIRDFDVIELNEAFVRASPVNGKLNGYFYNFYIL